MTNQIVSTGVLQVLNGSEQTRLADISGLLARPIGDLTESELGDLLDFRRIMAERAPRLASTMENARRELGRLDKQLEQIELGMRRGAAAEILGQFVERIATASKILDSLSDTDTGVLQLVLGPEGSWSSPRVHDSENIHDLQPVEQREPEEEAVENFPARNGVDLFRPSAAAAIEVSAPNN